MANTIVLDIASSTFPNVTAGITLNKLTKTWSVKEVENGGPVKKIFSRQSSGDWVYVADGNLIKLKSGNDQVGTLNDINPDSPGSSGSGFAVYGNVDFDWKKSV